MWLLQGYNAPDHSTIARFKTERLQQVLDDLFYHFFLLNNICKIYGILKDYMYLNKLILSNKEYK